MPDDLSLFGDDGDESPTQAVTAPSPVADWQVDLLRKALDAQGLTGMTERVAVLDGTLSYGPRPGTGFAVTASLPLTTADRAPERVGAAESGR